MVSENSVRTTPLSPEMRLNGLNHIAELRAIVFGLNVDTELGQFLNYMRNSHIHSENRRALAAIFYLANIPAERHYATINELTTDEKKALVTAMNHFKAVVSLFPKRLTMPV